MLQDRKIRRSRNFRSRTALISQSWSCHLIFGGRAGLRARLSDGIEAALFLPRGSVLRDGDLLEAEDGTLIQVESARENVFRVTAKTPYALMRAAYHLGNRHTPVELGKDYLKLEIDPVLQEMLLRLGVMVRARNTPHSIPKAAPMAADIGTGTTRHSPKITHCSSSL